MDTIPLWELMELTPAQMAELFRTIKQEHRKVGILVDGKCFALSKMKQDVCSNSLSAQECSEGTLWNLYWRRRGDRVAISFCETGHAANAPCHIIEITTE